MDNPQHRELATDRLTTLTDGVFAIILTLLVFDLRAPLANTQGQLLARLHALAPQFVSFLVSYIVNHALHGDTRFPTGHATIRAVYLMILASHIFLSIVALPMVLITFFFSLSGRFPMHKRVARYTFPIWLYVSVTGVVVFVLLQAYAY